MQSLHKIFVKNLNIYSKGFKQIWRMQHAFKRFLWGFFEGNTVKMEHNLKNTQNLIEKLN